MECEIGSKFCKNLECSLVPKNRTRTQISIMCQLLKPINEVAVSILTESKNSKNIYTPWLNFTVNYCQNVGKGRADLFGYAEQVFRKIDENMLQNCPIKACDNL